ncbi:hypothetical protein K4F52_010009 [Lecanicillium sp. MT-2017a]|nr:hypothetical protein K4F52_010009 [Lecanicillium sp. MT-2017a]
MSDEDSKPADNVIGDNQSEGKFAPDEENALLAESAKIKEEANQLFGSGKLEAALDKYAAALDSCPIYKHYERAVIHSNVAACHLKLEVWEKAIKTATASLEELEKHEVAIGLKPRPAPKGKPSDEVSEPNGGQDKQDITSGQGEPNGRSETADGPSPTATAAEDGAAVVVPVSIPDSARKDISRIRSKALLRRGRARSEAGGWSNLSGATEDYTALSSMAGLTAADKRTVNVQLRALPSRTKEAQEAETAEMWGKLKQLGNGILKPFGLSTNNFQMVKDDASGGYSVNFTQDNQNHKAA